MTCVNYTYKRYPVDGNCIIISRIQENISLNVSFLAKEGFWYYNKISQLTRETDYEEQSGFSLRSGESLDAFVFISWTRVARICLNIHVCFLFLLLFVVAPEFIAVRMIVTALRFNWFLKTRQGNFLCTDIRNIHGFLKGCEFCKKIFDKPWKIFEGFLGLIERRILETHSLFFCIFSCCQ